MENKNFEYTGWKINGFVALLLILVAIAGSIAIIVVGAEQPAPVGPILVISGILILIFPNEYPFLYIFNIFPLMFCF